MHNKSLGDRDFAVCKARYAIQANSKAVTYVDTESSSIECRPSARNEQ